MRLPVECFHSNIDKQLGIKLDYDCDCACPDDSIMLDQPATVLRNDAMYMLPPLYTDWLTSTYALAFPPFVPAGVAVLNHAAYDVLNVFQQPRTLAEGIRLIGEPPDGIMAVQRMARLGLLVPQGQEQQCQLKQQSQWQTLTAWLHITNACNLRCDYCYIHKTPVAMTTECGQHAIDAIVRSALRHGFQRVKLKYAGGEPTLNFPLVLALHTYALSQANEQGLELDGVVLSNGVGWRSEMVQALRDYGLRLMISLDGIGVYHDSQRHTADGRGSFDQVERSLDLLAAYAVTPSLSITLTHRNLEGLPATVAYALQRNLPFTINFYRDNDCSSSCADLAYSEEQVIAAMRTAFAVIESNLPRYSLLGALLDRTRLDVAHNRPCGVGHSYLAINPHGGVARCHMELDTTVASISDRDPLQRVQQATTGTRNHTIDERPSCQQCAWRYWCAGGCPALTYRATGRYDAPSPNCRIYQALFPDVLRLEGLRILKYHDL